MTEGRKVALVTGASRGIGAATAERLRRDGWSVETAERSTGVDLSDPTAAQACPSASRHLLPVLAVEATSLVMVAVTAAALRRAVEVEIRHVELEERSAHQFRLLNELINSLLLGTPDLERVTRSVAAVSSSALRADSGLVVISQNTSGAKSSDSRLAGSGEIYLASDTDPNPVYLTGREWDLVARVIKTGAAAVVEDSQEFAGTSFPSLARHGMAAQCILCVPLSLEDGSTGAILVGRCSREAFTDADINLLAAIGQQLSVAVRLARLYAFEHERASTSAERERLERDLLSIVSHDLRTPLTAIKMCVSAISKGMDSAAQDRLVRNIERNADRLAALVDDLLDMARLRSGRVELELRSTNLGDVITELAAQVWPMVETKNQALRVDLPARGSMRWNSLTLSADRKRIEQVLLNLIANAHKYAPEGSTITLGATPKDGEVRVFVRDEGPGIAPFERDRIFEKFYTSEGANGAEASQSMGLGLAIARSMVRLHGGEIGVQSRKGGGSTFFFTLPRTPHTSVAQNSPASEVDV